MNNDKTWSQHENEIYYNIKTKNKMYFFFFLILSKEVEIHKKKDIENVNQNF